METYKGQSVTVRIDGDLQKSVELLLESEGISMSELVRSALRHYTWNRERNQRMELWATLLNTTQEKKTSLSQETIDRFISWYLLKFDNPRQVDEFLAMPESVVEASVSASLDEFQELDPSETTEDVLLSKAKRSLSELKK